MEDVYVEPKRARRIRDRDRMISKGRRVAAHWHDSPDLGDYEWTDVHGNVRHGLSDWDDVFAMREVFARYNHDHLKVVQGCLCCCNPRHRHAGKDRLTMQERRAEESFRGQMKELF